MLLCVTRTWFCAVIAASQRSNNTMSASDQSAPLREIPRLRIEGNPEIAREFRKILGFEGTYNRSVACSTWDELVETTVRTVRSFSCTYEPLVRWKDVLLTLYSHDIFVNISSLGYYVNGDNYEYSYIGMFVNVDHVASIQKYAEDREDFHVYIVDAQSEVKMRRAEKERGLEYDKKQRRGKIMCRDIANNYMYIMFMRYPLDDILPLGEDEVAKVTAKYVWVQVGAVRLGQNIENLGAFIRGMLQFIFPVKVT